MKEKMKKSKIQVNLLWAVGRFFDDILHQKVILVRIPQQV
jgi:hypothetical protein